MWLLSHFHENFTEECEAEKKFHLIRMLFDIHDLSRIVARATSEIKIVRRLKILFFYVFIVARRETNGVSFMGS
jgi:hypothetical protein